MGWGPVEWDGDQLTGWGGSSQKQNSKINGLFFYLSDRYWPEIGNPKVWRTDGRTDGLTNQLTWVGARDTCVSKKVNLVRLGVSWKIFVNVESPKPGFPHFLGEAQCKKTSCTWQSVIIVWVWVNQPPLILKYKIMFRCCSSSSYGFADSPLSAASNNKSQQAPSRVYAALRLQWRSDARRKFSESWIAQAGAYYWVARILLLSVLYPIFPTVEQ